MNGIAAPIVAVEPAPLPDFLQPRHTVSVVMVVYMTGEALEQSLTCVLADPLVNELVVVDNGSTPVDAARLRTLADRDGRVTLLQGHGNIGFARGANLGARKAKGDLLLFLNPDAFLQPGCIAELARAIEDRPVPSIVGAAGASPITGNMSGHGPRGAGEAVGAGARGVLPRPSPLRRACGPGRAHAAARRADAVDDALGRRRADLLG